MIALGTLVGTQVHKRNVSEDLKKLERVKELREAAGEEPVKLSDSQKLGLKTKEGSEALSQDINLKLAKALKQPEQVKNYVESPEDTYEDQEEVGNLEQYLSENTINSGQKQNLIYLHSQL